MTKATTARRAARGPTTQIEDRVATMEQHITELGRQFLPAENDCTECHRTQINRHDDLLKIEVNAKVLMELVTATIFRCNEDHDDLWPHPIDLAGFVERHNWHRPEAVVELADTLHRAWMAMDEAGELKETLRSVKVLIDRLGDDGLLAR